MRPFSHPETSTLTLPAVLHALGDPIRLALLGELICGKQINCAEAAKKLENLPLSTRHHHLRILREAGLIYSTRQGTSVMNQLRREDLEKRFPGLLDHIFTHLKRPC